MRLNFQKIVIAFSLVFLLSISGAAQTADNPATGKVSKQTIKSELMKREMPYNIYLPKNYAEKSKLDQKFPVIYLLHGLTGNFENWAQKTELEKYASGYSFIIVMPDGANGWYTDSATEPDDKYESFLIKELIPEIESKFRAKSTRENRAVAGLSMGGYGAMKFGLKYPANFALVGSFSGALGITDITDKNSQPWISASVMKVYGEAESKTRTENDIFKIVRTMPAESVKNLPFIYLDCGTEDFLIANNRDFVLALAEKKIPHEYRELPGGHDWKFWNSQAAEFMRIAERLIAK
ncbi:MAG: esterase family protein [Pyrinomonadaceae bacterium]|nr:esterase family protein [Pyrinomonadaceae bacterium]